MGEGESKGFQRGLKGKTDLSQGRAAAITYERRQ